MVVQSFFGEGVAERSDLELASIHCDDVAYKQVVHIYVRELDSFQKGPLVFNVVLQCQSACLRCRLTRLEGRTARRRV